MAMAKQGPRRVVKKGSHPRDELIRYVTDIFSWLHTVSSPDKAISPCTLLTDIEGVIKLKENTVI